MCNCGGILVETSYHTNVCVWCGIERFIGYSPTCRVFSGHFARPLPPSYSRRTRFRELLRRVFALESGPKNDDPVWDYLTRHRPFKDSKDIMGCLKQSGLDNKHYSSIHLFTKLFSPYTPHTYSPDQLNQFVETLSKSFEHTLLRWRQRDSCAFFSYNWLIEKFLVEHKLTFFLPFVKRLQCPHRRNKYTLKMQKINAGIHECLSQSDQIPLTVRSQSD